MSQFGGMLGPPFAERAVMPLVNRDLSDRAWRWTRALITLLVGIALVVLAGALFDHQDLEFDLTSAIAAAVGIFCIIRALVLFWTQ